MVYNKLVRDKIPEIIADGGKNVTFRILHGEDYKNELEKKLVEEVEEFLASTTEEDLTEELADVLQVATCILAARGVNTAKVVEKFNEKYDARGGFYKGMFLVEVEDDERRN